MKKDVLAAFLEHNILMSFILKFLILFSIFTPALRAEGLNNFKTDYCTGYSEGPRSMPNLWKHCCVEHDLYFWAGGSKKDRVKADEQLKVCVAQTGQKIHAQLIYLGVQLGGLSPFKIKNKQWGNGWNQRASYEKLTEKETLEIFHFLEINHPEISQNLKQSFIIQLQSRLD